jgi:hypothetical protein
VPGFEGFAIDAVHQPGILHGDIQGQRGVVITVTVCNERNEPRCRCDPGVVEDLAKWHSSELGIESGPRSHAMDVETDLLLGSGQERLEVDLRGSFDFTHHR